MPADEPTTGDATDPPAPGHDGRATAVLTGSPPPPPGPVTGGDGDDEPRPRRWSPRARWAAVLGVVVVVGIVSASLLVRLPYYTLSPGSSRATEPLISVEGAPTFENDGAVDFLTVSLRRTTPLEALAAWINPDVDVVPEEDILGNQSPEENREVNLQMMADSKDSATYQALNRLGYEIPTSGTGAVVARVEPGSPAADALDVGDVVVGVDGRPVELNGDLVDAVGALPPSSVLTLEVEPLGGGERRTEQVTLAARADDPGRGFLGVSTFTRDLTFDFPVEVTIDSGRVGGPSAGLAFTLGLLDVLTADSITGGLKVATTGTMGLDGSVGPVGGVHQKVAAAGRDGVELLLVPSSELDEARRHADGVRVEPVDTLDDALAMLATVGGGDAVLPPAPGNTAPG